MGDNIEVVWDEFSNLSWAVLLENAINAQNESGHF
jgi:hypothetical protein